MPDDITIGELRRSLLSLEQRMDRGFESMERKIESAQYLSKEVYNAEHGAQGERITKLEDNATWFSRALIGAFVAILIEGLMIVLSAKGGL